ncbi:MAG TPA: hypothetical protein VE954_17115, partial [Oligoflexus sp.]|uniref:hypothetical protein n=1 Tax=Oligoflexus sp. TaxID=1971216 RepID=UPI002D432F05
MKAHDLLPNLVCEPIQALAKVFIQTAHFTKNNYLFATELNPVKAMAISAQRIREYRLTNIFVATEPSHGNPFDSLSNGTERQSESLIASGSQPESGSKDLV